MAVHDFVQLENVILRYRNCVKALVDYIECVTIACYFLLVTIVGSGLFLYKLPYSRACRDYSLNCIGSLGALDFCYLYQLFKLLRALFQIQFLLSGFLIYRSDKTQQFGVPFLIPYLGLVEFSHDLTSFVFPLYYSRKQGKGQ